MPDLPLWTRGGIGSQAAPADPFHAYSPGAQGAPAFNCVMTTRGGGVSTDEYRSLNLGFHVGDDPSAVTQNRDRAVSMLALPGGAAAVGEQVHGLRIARVTPAEAGRGWRSHAECLPGVDALITTEPALPLAIQVADCFPLAVWDAAAGVVGVAHCGWRGVAGGLPRKLIRRMCEEIGASPQRCRAWLGAGIGACCFQVTEDVLQQLPGAPASPDGPGRWKLDLASAIVSALTACGLSPAEIFRLEQCTCCEERLFFSHRRTTSRGGKTTGRQALIAWSTRPTLEP